MEKGKSPFYIETPHALSADEFSRRLGVTMDGLTTGEAARRLRDVGPNSLGAPPEESPLKRFLKHFNDLLIYVLMAAAGITALLGHWLDTGVILAVVVINAFIGFIQEGKAEAALESIRKMLSLHAQVRRDAEWDEIEADGLVPGDVVRLSSGDRVPADMRLIEATNLRVEESALTGESVPVEKSTRPVDGSAALGDRRCMAYSGTIVASGRGLGVVTATGSSTELGRINKMVREVQKLSTPLTRQMNSFSKVLSVAILVLAGLLFLLGRLLHGLESGELFLAAIGFVVAAIPEGLPAILTITLAIGVKRMAGRNAITRRLNSIETLGSVTVICSDKTGTLTRNEMTVRHALTAEGAYELSGTGYAPEGAVLKDGAELLTAQQPSCLRKLVEIMSVCNDSSVTEDDDGQWSVTGDPMEGALQVLARKAGFDPGPYERLAEIPFESENKFMATLVRTPSGERRIFIKGAPDRLLERCVSQIASDGTERPLERERWEKAVEDLSGKGLRVLASAERVPGENGSGLEMDDVEGDLVFVGIVGMIDPPRPEAIEAIRICHEAGIQVKMITGDHAGTALAIGREMGLAEGEAPVVGTDIETASERELRQMVKRSTIFARTSPEHKLRLVKALQSNGEVVAMTGDGVNDAPALKRADVGVAMGIKGTEATKQAADIVLADDNFTSIERAVEEGRTIYDNLRKAILFILPTNGAESLVVLSAVALGFTLPLMPVQILWVNMVTAVTLALGLAFEPAEDGLMKRPPRRTGSPILGRALLFRVGFVSALIGGATVAIFLVQKENGISLEVARTSAVNTLVFAQVFYLFNSRFLNASAFRPSRVFTNGVIWLTVGVLVALQLVFVYAPFMQLWFASAALRPGQWMVSLCAGFLIFLLVEAEKAMTLILRSLRSRSRGVRGGLS